MAWLVLAWQGWMAFGPQRWVSRQASLARPDRADQRYWFAVTLVCVAAINVIKYSSNTSCPWDLAEFGGAARHVSHWLFWLPDGGPGACFPSGHSSAAFSFFTLYFVWRGCDAARAKRHTNLQRPAADLWHDMGATLLCLARFFDETECTVRIERIVSHGHSSPEGFWYDQDQHEFVVLLQGAARLRFEVGVIEMQPGSFIDIPAHQRHRVEWTSPDEPTIWLAVHYGDS